MTFQILRWKTIFFNLEHVSDYYVGSCFFQLCEYNYGDCTHPGWDNLRNSQFLSHFLLYSSLCPAIVAIRRRLVKEQRMKNNER